MYSSFSFTMIRVTSASLFWFMGCALARKWAHLDKFTKNLTTSGFNSTWSYKSSASNRNLMSKSFKLARHASRNIFILKQHSSRLESALLFTLNTSTESGNTWLMKLHKNSPFLSSLARSSLLMLSDVSLLDFVGLKILVSHLLISLV